MDRKPSINNHGVRVVCTHEPDYDWMDFNKFVVPPVKYRFLEIRIVSRISENGRHKVSLLTTRYSLIPLSHSYTHF